MLVEGSVNGFTRYYHTTFNIASSDTGMRFGSEPTLERLKAEFGKAGGHLYDKVRQIYGVSRVVLSRRQLTVGIYRAHEWGDVEPEILRALDAIIDPYGREYTLEYALRRDGIVRRICIWLRWNVTMPLFQGVFTK